MGFLNNIFLNGLFGCNVLMTATVLMTDPLKIIGSDDAKNLHLYKSDSAYQLLDLEAYSILYKRMPSWYQYQ